MFQPPINKVVVTVETKHIGSVTNIMRAANLNPGSQLNPADLVQIVGTVVALPKSVSTQERGYEGYSIKDIEIGNKAIFSYLVIYDYLVNAELDTLEYKNMVFYKGKEYFLVDIQLLFAVIKKDSIKMINGFVMLEDMDAEPQILIPQYQKRVARAREATLSQIGNNLDGQKMVEAFPGDRVLVHPHRFQEYKIAQKKFWISSQKHLFGRVLK
jgi:hypothetical protein